MKSKKIATTAMLIALAMVFSYVEALFPIPIGIPGVKPGLANIVIVVGLELLTAKEVFAILTGRIFLSGLLFGNVLSAAYSLAGGICSFLVMIAARKSRHLSVVGVSMAGGVSHNMGQLAVAVLLVWNLRILYYLPVLLMAGVITGWLIGMISARIIPALKDVL